MAPVDELPERKDILRELANTPFGEPRAVALTTKAYTILSGGLSPPSWPTYFAGAPIEIDDTLSPPGWRVRKPRSSP